MNKTLLTTILLISSTVAVAHDAVILRNKGVEYAANGDFQSAQKYLCEAAELGYYTAQVECGYVLESSPAPVQNPVEAYVWFSVVIAREGTDTAFAAERREAIRAKLTASEIVEAELRAEEFISKHVK
ncbi:secretory immunoglobulin A-binding protein EsiB [bacterium MnTg04]|nr:secretory immunoglobulin A-binding protein EsiB [bacterium MnTg04]